MIPLFTAALLAGKQPQVYGDGGQSRDFTFVANVVDGNLLAADAPDVSGKVFNLAGGRSTTLLELLKLINEQLGTKIAPIFQPPRTGDVRESMADINEARRWLKYEPRVSFEEGLRRTVEYYRTAK